MGAATERCNASEEGVFNAIYRQLKVYVNEHNIRNSAYKQKIQEYTGQIANLTQHKTTAWINAMEHYEKYVQGEISKEEFRAVQDVQTKQKKFLLRQKNANLPMKNNTPGS